MSKQNAKNQATKTPKQQLNKIGATKEELENKLQEMNKKDAEDCLNEINDSLKKYNCSLLASGMFEGNQLKVMIKVIKKIS
jgi:hypothetical protein